MNLKSDEEWREALTTIQYEVTRQCGTEPPFTGKYWDCNDDGIYCCVCCGSPLFDANTKFDSGTGWPSFSATYKSDNILCRTDNRHGMVRIEVCCRQCGSHLGHVFPDGTQTSGQRYCINSASLNLEKI